MTKIFFIISMFFLSATGNSQSSLDTSLVALLDTIYNEDQNDRLKVDSLQKKYGWQSVQMDSLFKRMRHIDSINLSKVKQIINTYGWLGPQEVGKKGAQTLFLVIQHSDSLTQVTYLPVLRKAVKEGKAKPQELALLEDRVLTQQGRKQIYGSQLRVNEAGKYEFFPIEDEINVNKRRASVGLDPLENYAKHFDIDYVLPRSKIKK